ncbi:MAG: hypothetical protein II784_04530 [Oscillospiraceae bacterium]|nr:hypothetical protein [Oscillospiraceae bacterium]
MTEQCEYAKYISACIEGTLDEEQTERLFAHMAEHPECQALFDSALGMSEALSSLSAEVPEGFSESVMDKVRAEASAKAKKPFPLRRTVSLAVAAAAVVALVFFGASRLTVSDKKQSAAAEDYSTETNGFAESAVFATGTTGFSITAEGGATQSDARSASSGLGSSAPFASQKSAESASLDSEALCESETAVDSMSEPAAEEPQANGMSAPGACAAAKPDCCDESVSEKYCAYIEIYGEAPEAFAELEIIEETETAVCYLVPAEMLETLDYDYIEEYNNSSSTALAAVIK